MFCGKCGTKINDGDNFCTNCGAKVVDEIKNDNQLSLQEQIKNVKAVTDYPEDIEVNGMNTIKFGAYPQSDISGNKMESIDWLVLEKQNDKALLLSKNILDCKCFNEEIKDITWETCSLRKWLNDNFYNQAFNSSEKEKIIMTNIINDNCNEYKISGGNNTNDKFFLTSIEESYKYFGLPSEPNGYNFREATKGTEYAKSIDKESKRNLLVYSRGLPSSDWYKFNSPFWLRTPGRTKTKIAYIGVEGKLNKFGDDCKSIEFGVRPAMWVKI